MYIRELRVDGYGVLQQVDLTLDKPVTVVFGPNEAGKSTLLRFIRSMLYGIPTRKDPVERGEPVHGGRHGGRLWVRTTDGRELQLERYADGGGGGRKAGGAFTVRDGNGHELRWTQPEWERHVLGGVSERLFRQLFAVSLDELHELLTLQGEEIGNFLYHAGLAGGASLAEARRKLIGEMDKLYRPRGANQEINRLLASMKETEAAIRQSRSGIALFQDTQQELLKTQARLAELDKAIPPLALKAAELQGALEQRDWWLKRQMLLHEERDLTQRLPDPSAPPLPEEAAAQWPALLRSRQSAAERLEKAASTVYERREQLAALRWDDTLLERAEELEKLDAMREAAMARLEEREAVAAELQLLDEANETLLARLSPEWKAVDLLEFGSVTAEREPLRRLQQTWGETERKRERLNADAGQLQRQRDALQSEINSAAQSAPTSVSPTSELPVLHPFGKFRPQTREALQQAWNALEDEQRRQERTASAPERPVKGRRSLPAFLAAAILALSAVAVGIAGLFSSGGKSLPPLYLTGAAGLLILSFIAGWAGSRSNTRRHGSPRPSESGQQTSNDGRRRLEERLTELLLNPENAARSLLKEPFINEEDWKQLREAVQQRLAGIVRSERETQRLEDWQRRLAELDKQREALESEIKMTNVRLDELNQEWTRWLHQHKLPRSLTPDSLPELLTLAEQGQGNLRRRARAQERLSALEQTQSAFRETAAALFSVCPPPASMETDAALSVTWLYRRAAEQRAIREEARQTGRSLEEAEAAEREASGQLQEIEAGINRKIAESGAADEAAFEHRLRVDEQRRALTRERRETELRLEAGKTPQAVAALYQLLESHDEAALAALCREAEEAWQTADRERTEILDQRGRLAQELERLQNEAETEDRLMQLSEMESKLGRLMERYAVLAMSDRLLQQTKAVFEEERQPEVLRLASGYFAGMTAGAYTRITAPGETASIFVETDDRRVTDSAYLSRGTQEQLYLAMRFALAEAASRDVPLPLLLDDLFVHFDERRLRQTVPLLGDIAQNRQVILFTCHRHVADAVQRGLPAASIMNWEGRGAAGRFAAPGPGSSETASPG